MSEGDVSLKNPVTTPGIFPGTVRLVAQRLNHYTTPGPKCDTYMYFKDERYVRPCAYLSTTPRRRFISTHS
jgi:hypothetical protein